MQQLAEIQTPVPGIDTNVEAYAFAQVMGSVMERAMGAIESVGRMQALRLKRALTPADVEELYGISAETLKTWRSRGGGPDFVQQNTAGKVLYTHESISRWLAAHHRKGG